MAPPAPATPRRVLYAEDDRIAALLFTEALRGHVGYEVQVAEDGAEAIELARRWTPDILVIDAHLPDIDGVRLLAALRGLAGLASAPAFACSADGLADSRQQHLQAGFDGYWVKPVARDWLVAALDAATPGG